MEVHNDYNGVAITNQQYVWGCNKGVQLYTSVDFQGINFKISMGFKPYDLNPNDLKPNNLKPNTPYTIGQCNCQKEASCKHQLEKHRYASQG